MTKKKIILDLKSSKCFGFDDIVEKSTKNFTLAIIVCLIILTLITLLVALSVCFRKKLVETFCVKKLYRKSQNTPGKGKTLELIFFNTILYKYYIFFFSFNSRNL